MGLNNAADLEITQLQRQLAAVRSKAFEEAAEWRGKICRIVDGITNDGWLHTDKIHGGVTLTSLQLMLLLEASGRSRDLEYAAAIRALAKEQTHE